MQRPATTGHCSVSEQLCQVYQDWAFLATTILLISCACYHRVGAVYEPHLRYCRVRVSSRCHAADGHFSFVAPFRRRWGSHRPRSVVPLMVQVQCRRWRRWRGGRYWRRRARRRWNMAMPLAVLIKSPGFLRFFTLSTLLPKWVSTASLSALPYCSNYERDTKLT